MISVNDILINDITADIRKEDDAWNILVTIFLEVTQNENEEFAGINCHVASTLHLSENEVISNTSNQMLDTSKKYANINVRLTVLKVRIQH